MFNFSFYELMVFGIIALIVLGPEKLPQAVRTVGTYYSKFRRTIGTLKAEMEAELDLAETRQLMQQELAKIRESEAEMQKEMAQLRGSIQEFEQQQNSQLKQLQTGKPTDNIEQKEWVHPVANANPNTDYAYGSTNSSDSLKANATQPAELSTPQMTRPWENMWFLLGDYDRVRRLPPPPFLPNYTANPLLYDTEVTETDTGSAKPTEVRP
ncbi:Sec-independent protein translocase protein TatB [Psychrobacter phenylpyruvicus]|uniref:Sec-independent protein translocase protein TatB n=1 Tax=Psychrobacter phenylpyruvicus TaxID=29432 RepID=A0A379LQ40_9GAMM|nr:Sec-independent protein translocase protein TatB [Psychrobacter phenylpyruvicus]SUD92185.1 Sec-independent protein translocase protein TatB [Psychrobacter phenylpyruvicus]